MRSSTRRAALAACVALLLVTAGCSSVTNPTSTTATPTTSTTTNSTATTTTTTTGTWSPNASVDQYPPGVADNGTLTNVTTLLDAHADATANQSTKFTSAWTRGNDSFLRSYAHGANPTPYYSTYNRTTDGERTMEEVYGTGSRAYRRITFENFSDPPFGDQPAYSLLQNTTRGVNAWTHDDTFGPRDDLSGQLTSGNYSVNGTVERDGRTFVQLTADEVSPAKNQFYAAYEGTVLVTPEGIVHAIDASYITEADDEERRTEVSITVETDVEWSGPPSWMTDVPQLSISIVEDGRAVEIRNTGGAALPANTSLSVAGMAERVLSASPSRGDVKGTVTTETQLEPGDAVYVTAGADGNASSFALHDEPTRGAYTFGYAGVTGGYGNVYYRLATGIKTIQDE